MKKSKLWYHVVEYRRQFPFRHTYIVLESFKAASDMESWVRQNSEKAVWIWTDKDEFLPEGEAIGGHAVPCWNGEQWDLQFMASAAVVEEK